MLVGLASTEAAFAQAGEFRGMWVTRFEWPDRDPDKCRAKLDEVMQTLAAHNFNAVVFQVRGQCDTLYPSPEEPWSPLIAPQGADPGWDPLAYALSAAHANGLEFHAYINTHVAWQASKKQPPADPSHVYHRHFNDSEPSTCDWALHKPNGQPAVWGGDSYVWIAPGVPAAQAYIRRQVMYVVNNYDVDGVHFDRIRTPTANVSHDPISVARMQSGAEGNPDDLDFAPWTADQFTRFTRDMYAQIAEVKPHLRVSSCPLGLVSRERYPDYPAGFHYGVTKCHQDAQAWVAAGAMDFIAPQIYWADGGKQPNFSEILPDWIAHAAGRHVCPGHSTRIGVAELLHQVEITRESGGHGNIVFSYGSFKQRDGFEEYSRSSSAYAHPVATPAMPWKDNPADGIIIGTVTDADTGEPVVDAQIRRSDDDYVALSSADGLYSFLKVPPGSYTLTATKSGWPEYRQRAVGVRAGHVVRVDIPLGAEPVVVAVAEPRDETEELPAREEEPRDVEPEQPASTEPQIDEREPVEEYEPPPVRPAPTVRQLDTVVTRESGSTVMRWVLIGLMGAGVVVAAIAGLVYLTSRRN